MRLLIPLLLCTSIIAQDKLPIAVMELDGNGVAESDLGGLSERLRTELFSTGKFEVIERSRVDDILREQGFQQTGCTNTQCAVEVGQIIGVGKIVVGSVSRIGPTYSVSIRMIDVATGKVVKVATGDCDRCTVSDVLKRGIGAAAQVLAGLDVQQATVAEPTQAERVTLAGGAASRGLTEWEQLGLRSREQWVRFRKSGMAIDDWRAAQKKRWTVPVSVALSAALPGAGLYYCRNPIAGTTYLVGTPGVFFLGLGLYYSYLHDFWDQDVVLEKKWIGGEITYMEYGTQSDAWGDQNEHRRSLGIVICASSSVIYLANVIHTYAYVSRHNKGTLKHPPKDYPFKKVSLNTGYNPLRKETRLLLSCAF